MSEALGRTLSKCGADIALGITVAIISLLSQGAHQIWSGAPLELLNDHSYILFNARMMMEGQGFWKSDIAGYPLGYNAAYFPSFEPFFRLILMFLAQTGVSVFTVVKMFYVFGVASVATVSFVCLRILKIPRIHSACGAIAMAITPYFFIRSLNHDFLAIYISAPVGITVALAMLRCATLKELQKLTVSKKLVAAYLLLATSGLYYAFFSLMFIGCAAVSCSVRLRSIRPIVIASSFTLAIVTIMMFGALGPNIADALAHAPIRSATDQAYHGLSLADAIYAFDWIPAVARQIVEYNVVRPRLMVGEGAYEWPGVILTIIILSSPLVVLCLGTSEKKDVERQTIFAANAMICIGVFFATRGNIGYLFNEFLSPAIRGQARIMPFLTFLAIITVCLFSSLICSSQSAMARLWSALVSISLICSAIPASQALSRKRAASIANTDKQAFAASLRAMLERKDASRVTAVLQLPIVTWPEAPPINGFDPYKLHYPFIFDRRGSLTRWSYGASELQPGFAEMKSSLQIESDAENLARRANRLGFDAILIERAPLTLPEFNRLRLGLASPLAGRCVLYEDSQRVLIDIGASAECR
ncbi:hypothetical protein [Roseomonas sp. WA12]